MTINRHNYEAYFLDYVEGKLPPHLVAEVLWLIEEYPELGEELNGLAQAVLPADDDESFDLKHLLKKPVTELPGELNELLVAEVEGYLNESMAQRLHELSELYPHAAQHRKAMTHAILVPQATIFENKDRLRVPAHIAAGDMDLQLAAYMEGDLDEASRTETEHLLTNHPVLNAQLAALQRTRLEAEHIVFDNKAALHRRKPLGRIIALRFAAATAAAAAIALLWWLPASQFSNGTLYTQGVRQLQLPDAAAEPAASQPAATGYNEVGPILHTAPKNAHDAIQHTDALASAVATPAPMSGKPATLHSYVRATADEGLALTKTWPQMKKLYNIPEEAVAQGDAKKYMTIRTFLEDKVKSELWGSAAYPKEKYAQALAQRTADKLMGQREPVVEYENVSSEQGRKFRLRIGRFEIERKR